MGRVDYKAYGASFANLYDRMVPAVESLSEIENSIADVVKDSGEDPAVNQVTADFDGLRSLLSHADRLGHGGRTTS